MFHLPYMFHLLTRLVPSVSPYFNSQRLLFLVCYHYQSGFFYTSAIIPVPTMILPLCTCLPAYTFLFSFLLPFPFYFFISHTFSYFILSPCLCFKITIYVNYILFYTQNHLSTPNSSIFLPLWCDHHANTFSRPLACSVGAFWLLYTFKIHKIKYIIKMKYNPFGAF